MRSLLYRQSDTYAVHYGTEPLIRLSAAQEKPEEPAAYEEEEFNVRERGLENGSYISQIPPMRVERTEADQFGLDEVDRAELRRQEPEKSRELEPYIRREVDRMMSEGNIVGDESVDPAHIDRAVENIMDRLSMSRQPGGYLEELVKVMLLNEIFDRRRRCRRRGSCWR